MNDETASGGPPAAADALREFESAGSLVANGSEAALQEPWVLSQLVGDRSAPSAGTEVDAENLLRFRAAVSGALVHLESRRQEVNDLNVFPVADGDTGDNMALTLRAVLEELDRLAEDGAHSAGGRIDREQIVESVARAALLGARGNSGVILSQLIRGAAEELISRPGELIDPGLIGAALSKAANRAYESVRDPAEGTILTVARAMAHQIVADVAHSPQQHTLDRDADADRQDDLIAAALERAIGTGEETVKRGPQMLAALREAGVVDAGAYGLTVIFAGVVAALRGDEPPPLEHHAPARVTHPQHSSSTHRYCTNFAVTGSALDAGSFIAPLEAIGDSVLVVGDAATLKVHVHTDDPERATALFAEAGTISHLDVADMHTQVRDRSERLNAAQGPSAPAPQARPQPQQRTAALAVVNGEGIRALYEELGVLTLDGGPTLNPSTYELLAAIHSAPAEEVLVLPCSPNVLMAAERAAELSDREVAVVAALSQQTGLAAALALTADEGLESNRIAMNEAIENLRTAAVARAARDDVHGRFSAGEAVGLVGDEAVSWGEPDATLLALAAHICVDAEILSVLSGAEAPLMPAEVHDLLAANLEPELEVRDGGQSAYWWLLACE